MAEGYPLARQNGIPEARIVQYQAGGQGYLISIPGHSGAIKDAMREARIPFTGDEKPIKAMPGYAGISLLPQIGDHIVTAATASASGKKGAFRNGPFRAFTAQGGAFVTAFRHLYTEGADQKSRIIGITDEAALIDTETGVPLTTSGDTIAPSGAYDPDTLKSTVSADGTVLIVEFTPALVGSVNTHFAYRVEIDFAAVTQAVVTRIEDTPPYGTRTASSQLVRVTTGVDGDWSSTGDSTASVEIAATFPVCYGINADGDTVALNALRSSLETTVSSTEEVHAPGGNSWARDTTQDFLDEVTLQLPGGVSKAFTRESFTTIFSGTSDGPGGSGGTMSFDFTRDRVRGAICILYADPSVPLVAWEYRKTTYHEEYTASGVAEASSVNGTGTISITREVGILYGNISRTLFTEGPATYDINTHPARFGFVGMSAPGAQITFQWAPWTGIPQEPVNTFEAPASGTTTTGPTVTDITDHIFMKPMRTVQDQWPESTNYAEGFNHNEVFLVDVGNLNQLDGGGQQAWANEHRYYIGVKDADDWILAAHRKMNIGGSVIDAIFNFYAGTLGEAALKTRYFAYILQAAQEAETPNEDLIAQLLTGEFGPFEVRPSSVSRLSLR